MEPCGAQGQLRGGEPLSPAPAGSRVGGLLRGLMERRRSKQHRGCSKWFPTARLSHNAARESGWRARHMGRVCNAEEGKRKKKNGACQFKICLSGSHFSVCVENIPSPQSVCVWVGKRE